MAIVERHGSGLIGVEDVRTPYWARIQESVATAGVAQVASAVWRVAVLVGRRSWVASPPLLVVAVLLHLMSGVATAAGLFATANVFVALLQEGPSLHRLVEAVPALSVLVATYAARGLLDTSISMTQAVLAPRVDRIARDCLYEAVLAVDLAAFEDADFVELLGKASYEGLNQLKSANQLWQAAQERGAELLWRVTSSLKLPVRQVLPDGSYLSFVIDNNSRGTDAATQHRANRRTDRRESNDRPSHRVSDRRT